MPEAKARMSKNGLVVDGEGWFVINARESHWKDEGPLGSYCTFEGKRRFPRFGINISVLEPGERMGTYHREKGQLSAIVLAVGARGRGVGGGLVYTTCKVAARYGASVARETTDSAIAYAKIHAALPRSKFVKYRQGWLRETD